MAAEIVKQPLAKLIQLAYQVSEVVEEESSVWKQDFLDLKSKTEKLAGLLRQVVAGAHSDLYYESPARRIIGNTEQVVDEAQTLVLKCQPKTLMKRVFTIVPAAAFRNLSSRLESSIGDVSWLLRLSTPAADRGEEYLGLPPIAAGNPILGLIWELVATLHTGSLDERSDAAVSLMSVVRDRNGNLIIEEGGVAPLLKLIQEGKKEGQENAARAIGLLGRDPESVEAILHAGVCSVFAKILKQGPLNVQAEVAWAVAELASNHPKSQDLFAQHHIVPLLVYHLAKSIDAFVAVKSKSPNHMKKEMELEIPENEIKAKMKAMAARALCCLAKGNSSVCRSIAESRALMCFAILLEKGQKDVKYNSAMAVKEITEVAEKDAALRMSAAFKHNSFAYKAVVDQMLVIIEKEDKEMETLIPCIKAIGNLARTFRATQRTRRIIDLLVWLFDKREAEVSREAAISLAKFACTENCLHIDHSNTIVSAGGAKHLVLLVYFGEHALQVAAMFLLSYLVLHVPESEELAAAEVLGVLQWASRQPSFMRDETLKALLNESKSRLELYQSRGSRSGFQIWHHFGRVD